MYSRVLILIVLFSLICVVPASAANITATLDDAAGASVFAVNDSLAVEQCHIDSDGNAVFKGCLRVDSGGAECTVSEGLVVDGNVGIGTTGPGAKLHSFATTEQLRLGYDATNFTSFTVSSVGDLTIKDSNLTASFVFDGTNSAFRPSNNGGLNLGTSGTRWSQLFLSSAATIGAALTLEQTGTAIDFTGASPVVQFSAGGLRFRDTGNNTALFLQNLGNVGIGTTGPVQRLHVVGGIVRIDNDLIFQKGSGTNIYTNDANNLQFGTNGVTGQMILNTAGNLGIGSASTPGNRVDISGALAIGSGYFGTAAPSNGAIIQGNVGIGTTGPQHSLQVSDTSNQNNILWLGINSAGQGNMRLGNVLANGTGAAEIQGYLSNTASDLVLNRLGGNVGIGTTGPGSKLDVTTAGLGTTQTTSSGLALVNTTAAAAGLQQISPAIRWSGLGWKTDVTAASQAVDFRSYVVPVQGAANPTGYLSFGSSVNGAAYSDGQMVLTTAGNVGIGTTTPDTRLTVLGSEPPFRSIISTAATTGANTATVLQARSTGDMGNTFGPSLNFEIRDTAGVDNLIGFIGAERTGGADNSGNLYFTVRNAGSSVEGMRITNGGNLGIGTTGPGVLLHVKATTDTNVLRLEDSTGTCDHNPGSASEAVSCSSDRRLKTNIREAAPVLDYLRGLPIKDYTVMASQEEATGVVAQDILEKYPELVSQDQNGLYMVSVVSPWKIVKAIQELAETIEAQKKEIEKLKEKMR